MRCTAGILADCTHDGGNKVQGARVQIMPIVDIDIVMPRAAELPSGVAQRLADALGTVLDLPPGRLWLRLRALPSDCYAENGPVDPTIGLPVFVTVMFARVKAGQALEPELRALTVAVADVLAVSSTRVHVEVAPAGAGRIAFGGRMVH